ncbi:Phytoene dehydrogenase-related protein [Frankineae bacterium MT45]|nr:Phytoene dehydrogenase-related protein [Frankineae bacterium MT45]
MSSTPDAVVVGSGPNGLAAALTLAESGLRVRVIEAADGPGGGCRTAELTLPGFRHDVCSTVQSMAELSPFFTGLNLRELGVRLLRPEIAFAQPLEHGQAALGFGDLERTASGLGADAAAWRRLLAALTAQHEALFPEILGDLRHRPRHPVTLARFGLPGLLPARTLATGLFREESTRALFAGLAAHSMRRLSAPLTSAFAVVLAVSAHVGGWPVVEGGSVAISDALVRRLTELGVEFEYGHEVTSLAELPPSRVTLLDLTPRQLLRIGGDRLPSRYRRQLQRFRYGPGSFKIDYALSESVPWTNPECRRAGTLHVGGSMGEIAASEAEVEAGRHSDAPYVLVVQPSIVDPTRAPAGRHTLWAYCHVPSGSTLDRTAAVERQLERFAPGFKDIVLARATRTAAEYHEYNPNYVGGDINAGRAGVGPAFLGPVPGGLRYAPLPRWSRYRTPLPGVYLCSASTPPGGGVHGMCGQNAAREAIAREFG